MLIRLLVGISFFFASSRKVLSRAKYSTDMTHRTFLPAVTDLIIGRSKCYSVRCGLDVTPENFMRVMKGDKKLKANGRKVLES
ncbi:hypothetical protein FGIG_10509 [Fasciola gigantica]|uniref:Secreted protein n=1 Tax=Fasciola gigantica TaxID=46835 RepID=A0A504YB00_FASGI|nr:hypothetical protein FGIG_10509 [Fasciola gigantica]